MTTAAFSTLNKIDQLCLDLCHEFPAVRGERVHELMETTSHDLLARARFEDFVPLLAYRRVRELIHDEAGTASYSTS
jgi:hypothetical protein